MLASSRDKENLNEARINLDGHLPLVFPSSHGLLLAKLNTTSPMDKCYITDFDVFNFNTLSGTRAAIEYINNTQHGTWLLGITKTTIDRYAFIVEDFFLETLFIDMSFIVRPDSQMAFAARKGDKTIVSVVKRPQGPVRVVADLTERKDGKFLTPFPESNTLIGLLPKSIFTEVYCAFPAVLLRMLRVNLFCRKILFAKNLQT